MNDIIIMMIDIKIYNSIQFSFFFSICSLGRIGGIVTVTDQFPLLELLQSNVYANMCHESESSQLIQVKELLWWESHAYIVGLLILYIFLFMLINVILLL